MCLVYYALFYTDLVDCLAIKLLIVQYISILNLHYSKMTISFLIVNLPNIESFNFLIFDHKTCVAFPPS